VMERLWVSGPQRPEVWLGRPLIHGGITYCFWVAWIASRSDLGHHHDDLQHGMIGFAARRLMEHYAVQINLRNGYRDRDWHTRNRHRRNWGSQSCAKALFAFRLSGTPSGGRPKATGMEGISKSQCRCSVRRSTSRRRLFCALRSNVKWPCLWLDATYLKVRRPGTRT
jgi:hypothetical protein